MTELDFASALEVAKRRYQSSRHWKMLEGTPWENDAPVFAADLMVETGKYDGLAEECWTLGVVALRNILAEWGRDPVTNLVDWQRCVERIHTRAQAALVEMQRLEDRHTSDRAAIAALTGVQTQGGEREDV